MNVFLFPKRQIFVFFSVFLLISCVGNPSRIPSSNSESSLLIDCETPTVEILTPTATAAPVLTPTLPSQDITATAEALQDEENLRIFDQFISDLKTGEAEKIVGVWIENVLALRVITQPSGNPGFVSTIDDTATYFALVWQKAKNHGLLAHNYLAGRKFFDIQVGDIVTLVYGDGNYEDFEVTSIDEYQALQPDSPRSNFVDLMSGEQLSATELFIKVYMGEYKTTMQTCIANGAETEWGRQFTLAPPL